MTTMKSVGLVTLGMSLTALVGGGIFYWYRRRNQKTDTSDAKGKKRVVPSRPPRKTDADDAGDTDDDDVDRRAQGVLISQAELPSALEAAIRENFADSWPPDDETINNLTTEDVVVVAAMSKPVPGYEKPRMELITAKVRSVEKTHVRARVVGPVEYAEHIGAHAGHGFRVGDLIEVPRTKVLVAARSSAPKREGFNSKGEAAGVYEPSHETKKSYTVRPGTPYDLVVPYRTPDLEWTVDRKTVTMKRVGSKGNYEQIMFSEDSMRGPVTVRALDRDPKEGLVFVASWEFHINP